MKWRGRGEEENVEDVGEGEGTLLRTVRETSYSGHRSPSAAAEFFFGYLVVISFSNRIDVWGRLFSHFESVKVMTFASVTKVWGIHSHFISDV
jgi:hypothetical protein